MSDNPYVNFYTSDFLGGTSGMTAATKGVYVTLLCLMYETEEALTQNWETLARRCGCTKSAFSKAVEILEDDGKLTVTDGAIWSQKCDKHIALRRDRANSASAAAKKRWEKTKQKQGKPDARASSAQCQPEPEPEPYKEVTNVTSVQRPKKPDRFQEFWDTFPHRNGAKKGRKNCEAKYARAVASGVSEQTLIDAAVAYRSDADVQRGYGKGPEPWLNQECWNDEIAQPQLKAINGGRYDASRYPSRADLPENRTDPALEQIARLAGFGETQGHGRS